MRQLLSLESGSNDGLAFPLVVLGIVLVNGEPLDRFAWESLWAVLAAVGIGAAIGALAGRTMQATKAHGDVEQSISLLFTVVLALAALGAAKLANTDGILAVFVTGLAYNYAVSGAERGSEVSLDEGLNRFAVLPTFTLLGVALPWSTWDEMGWPVVVFAVGVVLVRRLPLIIALRRPLDFHWPATVFYGWFGPIGASALFYITHAHERGVTDERLWGAVTLAIALSVVAHGVTSAPGRRHYAAHADTDRVTIQR